jgi:hypothetical protein
MRRDGAWQNFQFWRVEQATEDVRGVGDTNAFDRFVTADAWRGGQSSGKKMGGGGTPLVSGGIIHLMLPGFGDYMKMGGEGKRGDFVILTQSSFCILSESTYSMSLCILGKYTKLNSINLGSTLHFILHTKRVLSISFGEIPQINLST